MLNGIMNCNKSTKCCLALIFCIILSITTLAFPSPPTPPRGIQAAALSSNEIEVHWLSSKDDNGIAGYRIYHVPGAKYYSHLPNEPWPIGYPRGPENFTLVGTVTNDTTFIDSTVTPETLYTYNVVAFDYDGYESDPSRSSPVGDHDHLTTSLPLGYTASVVLNPPSSVAFGAPFQIQRTNRFSPASWTSSYGALYSNGITGHTDIHYRKNNSNTGYSAWTFQGYPVPNNATITVNSTPFGTTCSYPANCYTNISGSYFFYAEAHLNWPNFPVRPNTWGGNITQTNLPSKWFQIKIGNPLEIAQSSLSSATLNVFYIQPLTVTGNVSGPYSWGVIEGGRLPPGLSINSTTGVVSGAPNITGAYTFTVMVEANSGAIATRDFSIGVLASDPFPPSTPTDLTAIAVSSSEINLSWSPSTDNIGVVRYDIFKNNNPLTSATTTSYQDRGLTPSTTNTYTVVAYDAAGNPSVQSLPATATTFADTFAPTVFILSPIQCSAVSGSVNISASASDNIGVAGVQFQLDNYINLGAEDTSFPYSITWDTPAVTDGLHTLTAVARDAAGNTNSASTRVNVFNSCV